MLVQQDLREQLDLQALLATREQLVQLEILVTQGQPVRMVQLDRRELLAQRAKQDLSEVPGQQVARVQWEIQAQSDRPV